MLVWLFWLVLLVVVDYLLVCLAPIDLGLGLVVCVLITLWIVCAYCALWV